MDDELFFNDLADFESPLDENSNSDWRSRDDSSVQEFRRAFDFYRGSRNNRGRRDTRSRSGREQFRAKAICFTINSDSIEILQDEYRRLSTTIPEFCRYGIFQFERGERTGRVHLQGYATADKRHGDQFWRGVVGPRASIRAAKGKVFCRWTGDGRG